MLLANLTHKVASMNSASTKQKNTSDLKNHINKKKRLTPTKHYYMLIAGKLVRAQYLNYVSRLKTRFKLPPISSGRIPLRKLKGI